VQGSDSSEPASGWQGIDAAARAIDVSLSEDQIRRLGRYRDVLLEWNQRFNLTAVTEPDDVDRRLVLDAVRMLPAFNAHVAKGASVVDIGSGGGLPAVPLAILRPDVAFTLIEATGKKTTFLRAAASELGLERFTVIHGRAEECGHDQRYRGAFDAATARAVASLPALVELLMPLVKVGGVALLPKGLELTGELAAGEIAAEMLKAAIISSDVMPGGEARLVVVRKVGPTPKAYPRRAGIPAREPLGGSAMQQRSGSGATA